MVGVKFNGTDTQMLVDSGAFYSMISQATAAQFKLRTVPAPFNIRVSGIDGDSNDAAVTTVKEFTMAGSNFSNVDFLVGGSEAPHGAVGMLGQNVLGIADAEYDLANGIIRLIRPHGCHKTDLAYWADKQHHSQIEALRDDNRHTLGSATLNGVKLRVLFDTGAYSSILSLRAAERAGVKPGDANVTAAGESSGIGMQPVSTWIARFASFVIGDEEIRNGRLRIGAIRLGDIDMLLGADFFLSHHIYVANEQGKIYFTYNGGPVFNLTTQANKPPDSAVPAAAQADASPQADSSAQTQLDAAAYERRGTAEAARHDYEHALADLTRACELEPKIASHFFQRGRVYALNGQLQPALADYNQTLSLTPEDVNALLARADLQMFNKQKSQANADLETASHLLAAEADMHRQIAGRYLAEDEFAAAIAQLDLWLGAHRNDAGRATELNNRCWARALWGQELDRAEADCSAALKLRTKDSAEYTEVLDSRGMVRLRRANYAGSIADYDAALARRPTLAWSLYGRAIAKLRLGNSAEGQADIAAATKQQADIAQIAGKYGVTP